MKGKYHLWGQQGSRKYINRMRERKAIELKVSLFVDGLASNYYRRVSKEELIDNSMSPMA